MSRRIIRLGSSLSFDEEQEKDIIEKIESLSSRHKLGEIISVLIRVAFESPSKLENKEELARALSEIEKYGMSHTRSKFFNSVNKKLEAMKIKVDAMHDMNMKLLNLAQFGKHLGLETKTNNMLMAQFALEQQLTEICNTLGVTHVKHVFSSNKIQEAHDKADNIFKYIIETYDGIVTELQDSVIREVATRITTNELSNNKLDIQQEVTLPIETNEIKEQTIEKGTKTESIPFNDSIEDEKDFVDFGEANLDALSNFFGGD